MDDEWHCCSQIIVQGVVATVVTDVCFSVFSTCSQIVRCSMLFKQLSVYITRATSMFLQPHVCECRGAGCRLRRTAREPGCKVHGESQLYMPYAANCCYPHLGPSIRLCCHCVYKNVPGLERSDSTGRLQPTSAKHEGLTRGSSVAVRHRSHERC